VSEKLTFSINIESIKHSNKYYLTPAGFKGLKRQLNELKNYRENIVIEKTIPFNSTKTAMN